MSLPTLTGQRVVIVGGSSGIGYAVAEGALAEGAEVVIGSSNGANVEAAVERLGKGASGGVVDVGDEASVAAFFERLGAFDHLVFTAGIGGRTWSQVRSRRWTSARRRDPETEILGRDDGHQARPGTDTAGRLDHPDRRSPGA